MKMKSIMALAMGAVLTLASCSKDENTNSTEKVEEQTVVMTIKRGDITRAEGANVGNGTSIAFASGKLYFTDANGIITKVLDVVTSGGSNTSQIDVMATGAQTIPGVPSNTRKVYIVGNVGSGLPTSPGGNISAVKDMLITIGSQYDAAGAVANAALYGQDEAMVTSGSPYTAAVTVNPIAARIEIDKFTGTSTVAGALTAYQVDGIFVNNYYSKIKLQGAKSGAASPADDLVYNGTEADGQNPAIYLAGSTAYPAEDNGKYYDFAAAGIGSAAGLVYTPSTGATWSYNLLAPAEGAVPHIVIRFSGFGAGDLHEGKIRYITVTGFEDVNDLGTPLALQAGKIYRIKNFRFDETDLDTDPEVTTVTAQVTVTLAQWDEIDVNPIH